jgi:uncharacterized protein
MIKRKRNINRVNDLLKSFPVVGIIGPRQVGKTTLVKELLNKKDIIYLDLESDEDQAKLSSPSLFLKQFANKCVVLDEIQIRQDLFPILRSLIDEDRRPGRFVLLGSASPVLLRKSADSLAGRIAYFELLPFSLEEIGNALQKELWIKGGFPDSFLASSFAKSLNWRKQFIRAYVERDLPLLGLNTNQIVFRNFLRMLANQTCQIWNSSAISLALGVSAPTIRNHISFLEGALLIRILEPFHVNIKKRIVKSPKILFKDTGLLHGILDFETHNDLLGNPLIGHSWENFVINQILSQTENLFDPYFFATHQGSEVDLVLVKSGKPEISIEIKYTNAPRLSKGFLFAIETLRTNQNFIITPSSDRFPIHEKVEVINLQAFSDLLGKR